MKSRKIVKSVKTKLFAKAETFLKKKPIKKIGTANDMEKDRFYHILQIHQIELEMQNDELKKANNAVETAGKKYLDLYNFSTVGYFTINREGVIRNVNLSGSRLLDIDRLNLMNKNLRLFVSPDTLSVFDGFTGKVFGFDDKASCEVVLVKKTGERVYVYMEGIAPAGSSECSLNIIDITDRKLAEESVKKMVVKLEESNELLESFAYTVAHDLQSPLQTVLGFMTIIEKRNQEVLGSEAKGHILIIKNAINKMSSLIKDLLSYAKLNAERTKYQDIELNAVVDDIFFNINSEMNKTGKTAKLSRDNLARVKAVQVHMTQLFQNFISNAVKFTVPGVMPEVHVSAEEKNNEYLFSVTDNGIGIDEKNYEKIFKFFQKLHSEKEYPGSGIGLATCKKISEIYGGKIWIESKIGKGSTFYFTISKSQID